LKRRMLKKLEMLLMLPTLLSKPILLQHKHKRILPQVPYQLLNQP
jgi:hypothetical protein